MITQYFTFGINQYHPCDHEEEMDKKVVKITAIGADACRRAMIKMFGVRWAFQYNKEEYEKSLHFKDYQIYLSITVNFLDYV